MGLSSPGIGSNLDVNGIITKLMSVEAQPLTILDQKEASFQAKLTAFGNVSGSLNTFQGAVGALSTQDKFQALNTSVGDSTILSGSASSKATAGSYNIAVAQLAQAQTLATIGKTSTTALIGSGATTTLNFQFGTIGGGTFQKTGTALGAGIITGGIAAGSLSINGTTIATNGATTSAKLLADAINLKTGTTQVTATAGPTVTAALGAFTDVNTGAGDAYTMSVGGVTIANLGASSTLTAAELDTALTDATPGSAGANLTAAGITVSGSAAAGTLTFTRADGANIAITQTLTNPSATATGGFAGLASGVAQTTTGSVSLTSDGAIAVAGSNPALAGLTAGNGNRTGAGFTQDPNQSSGVVTIDSTNNSLQGIRDAINKANLGVTASIVSDGSATPVHLVLTSKKTGAASSMKITVAGDADLQSLLAYDPANAAGQQLTESSAAQDTLLTVNGINVTSATNTVSEAIQGVTLNIAKTGSTTFNVSRDTGSISTAVNSFVKAFNDLNTTLKSQTSYNAATKKGGPLLGDSSIRSIQTGVRQLLGTKIPGLNGNITTLSDIGVSFQKDGSLALDTNKLQAAISKNPNDIGALFAAMGTTSDSLVGFVGSTSATKPGTYAVSLSALATHGTVTGNANLNTAPITISANTAMSVSVDGTTAVVALAAGSYTSDQLASLVQSAINGTTAFSALGSSVKATVDSNGFLNIASNRYGTASKISLADSTGTSAAALIGGAPASTTGIDVAGSIGGQPATGSGQTLTGSSGAAEGLKILVGDNASGGTISFSQGYAHQMKSLIDNYLGTSGLISGRTNGINTSIKDIGTQRDTLNARLTQTEKRYRAQFTALDTMISSMNSTSAYLTQQLANLPKIA